MFHIFSLPLAVYFSMADQKNKKQKTYHKKATGAALATVRKHSKEHDLKLFASCFW
jgi:glutathione S-transferase